MGHGRHAKPNDNTSNLKKVALAASVGLGAVAVPATFASSASAATVDQWDKIAYCESTGNWQASGQYSGGLQIGAETWADYGGTEYAPTAGQATKQQQIMIAEKILAGQGPEAWAVLTHNTGDTSQGSCQGLIDRSDSYLNGGPNPYGSSDTGSSDNGSTETPPASSTSGIAPSAQEAIDWALAEVEGGQNYYVWGGEGPNGYDCSGFLQAAWRHAGVEIPRDTYGMDAGLPHVSQSEMRPGDLILWDFAGAGASPNHVTMYLGDGKMVEMSGSRGNVVSNVEGRGGDIVGVVRPAADEQPTAPATPPADTGSEDDGEDTTTPPPSTDPVDDGSDEGSEAPSTPVETPEAGRDYTVKAGDYLTKIAKEQDIRGGWEALYSANKAVIGDNPNLIYPGQVLKLPSSDPYEFSGLPQMNQSSPSAIPLQKELKRVGYMASSVEVNDNYGPRTQAAVARFHQENTQFAESNLDPEIGPKGWAFLQKMADGSAEAPKTETPEPEQPAPSEPAPEETTPEPEPTTPAEDTETPPASDATAVLPVDAALGTPYHQSGSMWSLGFHTGVDFAAPEGTSVKAAAAGTVELVNYGGSYGNHVVINHGDGTYTLYAHLSSVSTSAGASVSAGDVIGKVGSTGNSTGPHLHFEVRNDPTAFSASVFSDPVAWLRSHGVNV